MIIKKKSLLKGLLILLVLNYFTYLLIGESMLEARVFRDFKKFNASRLSKTGSTILEDAFFFSSCGDEFFRDKKELNQNICRAEFSNEEYSHYAKVFDFNDDVAELLTNQLSSDRSVNCIIYKVCHLRDTPIFLAKLNYTRIHSTHLDFHALVHNGQLSEARSKYVWLFFMWFELQTEKV